MKSFLSRLDVQIGIGIAVLLIALASALFWTLSKQARTALYDAAQQRQAASLRILLDQFQDSYPDLQVNTGANGAIETAQMPEIPDLSGHDIIDTVGAISGETATLFAWDPAERDFIRVSTNIIKPDGSRAVGTYLGRDNPVYAAMVDQQLFSGEATILGERYFTEYLPVLNAAGDTIGILYVGVAQSSIESAIRQMTRATAIEVLIGLALAMGATVLSLRWLLKPIERLEGAIVAIRDGAYDTAVSDTARTDSIGRIAQSTLSLREALSDAAKQDAAIAKARAEQDAAIERLSAALSDLADRNLAHRITPDDAFPAEYELLRENFNTVAQSLEEAMTDIATVAAGLHKASGDLGGMSSDLSRRVERQAATLEETAAAIEGLTQSSQGINSRVNDADKLAKESVSVSEESRQRLETAIEAIKKIETASEKIDSIVTLIEEIAFQTNLLALNAGVEAARAGEAGQGFAVVATEVRGLAQRASHSVGEIRALTKANMSQVQEGSALVQSTGESIRGVLDQIRSLGVLVSEITGEVENQTHGLGEINLGMRELDTATQENAALAGEAETASTALRKEAETLSATVRGFRLGGATPGVSAPRARVA